MAASIAELQIEVAVLKQQLEGAEAERALFKELLASKDSLLTAKDKELQSLLPSYSEDGGRPKRARLAAEGGSACPLNKDEILDEVFSFVGLGEYYYVAGVSRRWRGRYIKLCYNETDDDDDNKLWTSLNSTIVTAARLQLALDGSVSMETLQQNMTRLSADISASSIDL